MNDFVPIMIVYMIVITVIMLFGLAALVYVARFNMKGAERISKNIANGMAAKVEDNIKRDIDSGKFFY